MAEQARGAATARRKSKPLRYFYLVVGGHGNLLFKKIHINVSNDELTAWCYPLHERVVLPYKSTRKRIGPAFNMTEASKLLNRKVDTLQKAINEGHIKAPQHTYGLSSGRKFKYMWSEDDILDAHAYFLTVHRGRPRKDGLITPQKMPTVTELKAMMRDREILYVKRGDTFVPTWQAPDL